MLQAIDFEGRALHALWLRDNCPCPACLHPSGQRLLDTVAIPRDAAVTSASQENGTLEVVFDDGHVARFDAEWLRRTLAPPPRRTTLWRASDLPAVPEASYDDVAAGGAALRDWLASIDEYGTAVLRGVPTEPGTVTRVAELFGYVRETNYGRLFDVKSVVDPNNLAYTGLALGGHTDNPYRDPTPTLQLLHCLSSSTTGGDSTLVDGFAVAEALRERDPAAFELLSTLPIRFRFADADTELEAEFPVIGADLRGAVAAIHFNNRSKAPVALPPELVVPWYDAYRAFGELLESDEFVLRLHLEAGDLFVVDNLRVLHGRTGFSGGGERWFQGCYADRDGLRSRLAVLSREHAAATA